MNSALPPRLPLANGAARPAAPVLTRRQTTLDAERTEAIRAIAARHGLTLPVVYTAALVRCLADWSQQPSFKLEVSGHGPVDVDLVPGWTFAGLAKDVQARLAVGPRLPLHLDAGDLLTHRAEQRVNESVFTWDTADLMLAKDVPVDLAAAHTLLLQHLASGAHAWTGQVPSLLPPRQALLRERVNATEEPLPHVLLHEPFWRQASLTPDAVAVIDGERLFTYQEMKKAATALAHKLIGHGAGPSKLVAITMHKGWEQVVAALGILGAGAAYVPIAPDLPEERFLHLLSHAQATILVTQPDLASRLPRTPGVWRVVVDDSPLETAATLGPPWGQTPHDLAYVIYTSGSTGLPKGVMIDHRGAVNTITDINRRFRVGAGDRVLALSALGFDLSVYDIFGLLGAGGTVVIPPPHAQRAPWEWVELMEQYGVSVWNTVPALMEMLVTYVEGRGLRLPESLRLVLMSGDWIPVTLPDRIQALAAPGIELIGMGGATEASIWSNYYRIGAVDPAWPSIPYGMPLANQTFDVLDADLRPRPTWVPGELHIGGAGVAMGYWRDEAKTRASFVAVNGRRLYKTGDMGRYLPDGNLEFLGRQDFQVKIHGFRVELGEIEAALLSHDSVSGAVVSAVDAGAGSKRLIAYVTPASVVPEGLRGFAAAKLPSYMVPDRIVAMESFPLTPNGKVDRNALEP